MYMYDPVIRVCFTRLMCLLHTYDRVHTRQGHTCEETHISKVLRANVLKHYDFQ